MGYRQRASIRAEGPHSHYLREVRYGRELGRVRAVGDIPQAHELITHAVRVALGYVAFDGHCSAVRAVPERAPTIVGGDGALTLRTTAVANVPYDCRSV